MSPALRAEVGRVFLAEARDVERTDPAEAKRLRDAGFQGGGRTLRIVAPHFVAGALVGPDGTLGEVAPILARHTQGLRTGRDLRAYAVARRWTAEYVGAPS